MSQENVETVRRVIGALEAGDYGRAASHFEPGAEWHNTDGFPGPAVCRGFDEIRAFWKEMFENFDREGLEVERIAHSGGLVVVGLHSTGTGRASGVPIDVHWASVYELRAGKVVRVTVHGGFAKALGAAGLSE